MHEDVKELQYIEGYALVPVLDADSFVESLPAYGTLSIEEIEDIKRIWEERKDIIDPYNEGKVRPEDFLMLVDVSDYLPALEEYYKEEWRDRLELDAWIRLIAFNEIKRFRYNTELNKELEDYPIIWKKLGFNRKPAYSTLCHFLNTRLGSHGKKALKDFIQGRLIEKTKANGIRYGNSCSGDSLPLSTSMNDPQKQFNVDKGMHCYKWQRLICNDQNINVEGVVSGGKEYDGHYHFDMVKEAVDRGIEIEQLWGDCHHSSNPSYAILSVQYGIDLRANLPEDGSKLAHVGMEDIKAFYQRFWKEDDFKVGASEEDMLGYLVRKGMNDYLMGVDMINSGWRMDLVGNGLIDKGKSIRRRGRISGNSNLEREGEKLIKRGEGIINRGERSRERGEKRKRKAEHFLKPVGEYYKGIYLQKEEERKRMEGKYERSIVEGNNGFHKRKRGFDRPLGKGIIQYQDKVNCHMMMEFLVANARIDYGFLEGIGNLYRLQ